MKRYNALLAAWLLVVNGQAAFATNQPSPKKQVEMHRKELGGLLEGGQVKLVLSNGATVQGDELSVTPDALVVQVTKSSDKLLYQEATRRFPADPFRRSLRRALRETSADSV